jgi:hypothetical protein
MFSRHIRSLALAALFAANLSSVEAQQYPMLPPGSVIGNLKSQSNPSNAVLLGDLAVALGRFGLLNGPPGFGVSGHAAVFGPSGILDAGAAPVLMTAMPPWTLKANATSSGNPPADISIPALTQKVSPVSGDMIMIVDSAASNAFKMATVGSIAAAGSVASIGGQAGAFTVSTGIKVTAGNDIQLTLTNALLAASAGNPTGTNAAGGKMMGTGASACHITPVYSGRVTIHMDYDFASTTGAVSAASQLKWGTGTPPANGDAPIGTAIGNPRTGYIAVANAHAPASHDWILFGLTPGVQVWFDSQLSTASGSTVTIAGVNCTATEF